VGEQEEEAGDGSSTWRRSDLVREHEEDAGDNLREVVRKCWRRVGG
jgi:hypothetical protein